MKLKKTHIISLILFSGLLFTKPVLAEDTISSDNTPMGHYIEQIQTQETSKDSSSDPSATTPNIRARLFAAAPAANVPSDLKSDDNTLPRKDAVDIASYQSWMTQADFNSLKASGVKSIVVKLTEGTNYTNPYAANQIKMAQNAGLNVAVYHYARLTGANSQSAANSLAIQEAAYFAKIAKSFGLSSNIVMIMDCEQPYRDGSGNIIGPNPITVDWATAGVQFANTLKTNGYSNTKFYTSASWIGTNTATCQMNYNTLGGPKNLWAAQYLYGKPSSSNLQNTQYGAWQYTSQMYYQGTPNLKANAVDTSIDYSNFFNAKPDSYITKGADGNYYGYSSTGNKLFGQQKIKGNWYLFNRNTGAMLYGQQKDINNQWYLFNRSSGIMMYGQQKDINNQWYLFNRSTGIMMYGQQKDINNQWYLFNRSTGIMMHGLQKDINEQTYYFSNNSGTMQYGWQIIDNINYYFQPSTGILINT